MDALPYLRAGDGPTFVLVHGYLGGADQWKAEIGRFSGAFDVVAPNLPGFGAASDLTGCGTIAGMAAAVHALLDDLGIGEIFLLGHSMGGMVVQEMAAMRPERVARLVLYGTGPLGAMPDRFEPWSVTRQRLHDDGVEATVGRIAATWFKRGADAASYPLLLDIGACANPQAVEAALDAISEWDGRGALQSLTMPTLVLWGEADRSYRWPQIEALWTELPNAHLAVIPGVSHAAHLEKPMLFHALVEDFLSETE
jgi:pimeloyl-ACP methyl ester carboxylesterase